jgi:DNA-directed RNA polymerase subunit RPC12/RpoP
VRRDIHRNPPRLIARVGFDLYQRASVQFMLSFFMISFTYRCPRTGQNVHGHVVNDLIGSETYEPVTCTECGHTHLVNLKTGELLEEAKTAIR